MNPSPPRRFCYRWSIRSSARVTRSDPLFLELEPRLHAVLLHRLKLDAVVDSLQALTHGTLGAWSRVLLKELFDICALLGGAEVPQRGDRAPSAERRDLFRQIAPMRLQVSPCHTLGGRIRQQDRKQLRIDLLPHLDPYRESNRSLCQPGISELSQCKHIGVVLVRRVRFRQCRTDLLVKSDIPLRGSGRECWRAEGSFHGSGLCIYFCTSVRAVATASGSPVRPRIPSRLARIAFCSSLSSARACPSELLCTGVELLVNKLTIAAGLALGHQQIADIPKIASEQIDRCQISFGSQRLRQAQKVTTVVFPTRVMAHVSSMRAMRSGAFELTFRDPGHRMQVLRGIGHTVITFGVAVRKSHEGHWATGTCWVLEAIREQVLFAPISCRPEFATVPGNRHSAAAVTEKIAAV